MLLRDSLYTVAWFGLMTTVWFGWAQESPPRWMRNPLILGSCIGVAVAAGFGVLTAMHWADPTALDGRYAQFGLVVGAEFILADAGAAILALNGKYRWTAWWVALVVAGHFVSLAWLLEGPSLAVLGVVQVVALVIGAVVARADVAPSSRWVGPLMGLSLLLYALVAGALTLGRLAGNSS